MVAVALEFAARVGGLRWGGGAICEHQRFGASPPGTGGRSLADCELCVTRQLFAPSLISRAHWTGRFPASVHRVHDDRS
jgi:hypothetical protein